MQLGGRKVDEWPAPSGDPLVHFFRKIEAHPACDETAKRQHGEKKLPNMADLLAHQSSRLLNDSEGQKIYAAKR